MCKMQKLYLYKNQIGDAGVEALAKAATCGALQKLEMLWLNGNNIGDGGCTALAAAAASGALASITVLRLSSNKIGDAGMIKFSEACAGGAMALLQASSLPTAFSLIPETWHAHSPDSDVLFGVQYAGP